MPVDVSFIKTFACASNNANKYFSPVYAQLTPLCNVLAAIIGSCFRFSLLDCFPRVEELCRSQYLDLLPTVKRISSNITQFTCGIPSDKHSIIQL